MYGKRVEARVGFEPTDKGFADLPLRPLGYRAVLASIAKILPRPGTGQPLRAHASLFFCGRQRRSDFGFTQKAGGFFGRRRVDIKAGAPFKARDFCKFGNDLEVPVVMIVNFFADGRSVDHVVVGRKREHIVETR